MDSSGPAVVGCTCLALGLTYDETQAVWAILRYKRLPQTAIDAYLDLAEAVRQVKPSALPVAVLLSLDGQP